MPDPRVILIAENTSRRFGGEAAIPFHLFRVLSARGADVRLVTHERNRPELTTEFPDAVKDGRVAFVPDRPVQRLIHRVSKLMPHRVAYFTVWQLSRLVTQRTARGIARRLVREHAGPAVVHQPTPVSPKDLSTIRKMGAPVVFGPFNGGMTFPPGFRSADGPWVERLFRLGRLASRATHRLFPAKREAALLLAANDRTRAALPHGHRARVELLSENGVDLPLWKAARAAAGLSDAPAEMAAAPGRRARFAFVGRLVDWKAVDLLVAALGKAVAAGVDAELDIIGAGPTKASLEQQARDLGLTDRVTFAGWMSQADVSRRLAAADAFVLPSLYECGGAVVLEAMAAGLPVIATRWGGPADYVDDTCGVLVDPTSRDALIDGFAAAIAALAADPARRAALGEAGRRRVTDLFDWERKVDRIQGLYREVAAAAAAGEGSAGRPSAMPSAAHGTA
ncbi:MAG: family glycosyltransferase [Phycisphaerales bacterium]|nr:family glycosyltransferase [Phycisphaerales bacterium]